MDIIWPVSLGATAENEFTVGKLAANFGMTCEAEFSADTVFGRFAKRTMTASIDATFVSDGPATPYPGYPFAPRDVASPICFDFTLELSQLGSFVFPAEFDSSNDGTTPSGGGSISVDRNGTVIDAAVTTLDLVGPGMAVSANDSNKVTIIVVGTLPLAAGDVPGPTLITDQNGQCIAVPLQ